MTRGEGRKTGEAQCKCCSHPGQVELDAMLLNGAKYSTIIARMKAAHPAEPVLNASNLSRHKKAHLLTKPIKITEADPETGEVQEGYIIGHLSRALVVQKEALPAKEDRVSVEDGLWAIINAGIRNILANPALVGPKEVLAALEIARKYGIKPEDGNSFDEAWRELGKDKQRKKSSRTRTTKVTVEETVEQDGDMGDELPRGEVVEGSVVPPSDDNDGGWSDEDLKLLGGPDGEGTEQD